MRIGIAGGGHWGRNIIRTLISLLGKDCVIVADPSREAIDRVRCNFPGIEIASSLESLCEEAQAIVVVAPPSAHHSVTMQALMAERDVLVEKPMGMSSSECQEMIDLARHSHCVLLVGHTFLYNPAILEAKRQLQDWRFRRIYYLEAFRRHLGLIRDDVDCIWDLAAHDISIFNYLLDSSPLSVQAIGWNFLFEGKTDTASLFLNYPGGVRGAIHTSWIDSSKRRELYVVGAHTKLCFDDLNPEWLVIEDKGAIRGGEANSFGEFKAHVLSGESRRIHVPLEEPLKNLCRHFLACIERKENPRTPGSEGKRVVRVLEAASVSLKRGGALVEVING